MKPSVASKSQSTTVRKGKLDPIKMQATPYITKPAKAPKAMLFDATNEKRRILTPVPLIPD